MAIFGPKPWVNPFGKTSIVRLFELLVFTAQKGVFSLQIIVKDIFVAYIAQKKKVGKMAIFGPKPWVNSLGKISIFGSFKLLVLIAQKGVFYFKNIVKDIFFAYIAQKKKLEKWPFLVQNPFGKISIFRPFKLLVLIAQKGVFSFQKIVKDIFLAYIA